MASSILLRRFCRSFTGEMKRFRSFSTGSAGDDLSGVVSPATATETEGRLAAKDFTKNPKSFKHERIYTTNTKILVINEDNFSVSKWIHGFVGSGMLWAATAAFDYDDKSLNSDGRRENMECLRRPVTEEEAEEERIDEQKKEKDEKEQKKKNKEDRKNERIGKKMRKKKEELLQEDEEKKKKKKPQYNILWNHSVKRIIKNPHVFKKMGLSFDRVIIQLVRNPEPVTKEHVKMGLQISQYCLSPGGEFHVFIGRNGEHNTWAHQEFAAMYGITVKELRFNFGPDHHPHTIWRYFDEEFHKNMIEEERQRKEKEKYSKK